MLGACVVVSPRQRQPSPEALLLLAPALPVSLARLARLGRSKEIGALRIGALRQGVGNNYLVPIMSDFLVA